MVDLMSMILKLGAEKAAASPMMELGKGIAAGDIAGGMGDFAKSAYGPQMDFGKAMMDPNANGFDAYMKMQSAMADNRPKPAMMQMAPMTPMAQATPQAGTQNQQQSRMPMAQGLPQGLLSQLGYRR